jgi:hypothetical protein
MKFSRMTFNSKTFLYYVKLKSKTLEDKVIVKPKLKI